MPWELFGLSAELEKSSAIPTPLLDYDQHKDVGKTTVTTDSLLPQFLHHLQLLGGMPSARRPMDAIRCSVDLPREVVATLSSECNYTT